MELPVVDTVFSLANLFALVTWVALILGRFIKPLQKVVDPLAGFVAPALLAVAYAVIMGMFWGQAQGGGFGSLQAVGALFAKPELLLAGWIHYLAFDLFVGGWIARTASQAGLPGLVIAPILVLTFLFGPVGYLAFALLRLATRRAAK
jgi:hypothetical protein